MIITWQILKRMKFWPDQISTPGPYEQIEFRFRHVNFFRTECTEIWGSNWSKKNECTEIWVNLGRPFTSLMKSLLLSGKISGKKGQVAIISVWKNQNIAITKTLVEFRLRCNNNLQEKPQKKAKRLTQTNQSGKPQLYLINE